MIKIIKKLINQEYVFSAFSKVFGVFIAMIYSVFFNRYLGPQLKGEAAIISNYISVISSLVCFGMYQAYPYFKKKEGDIFYPFLNTMLTFYGLMEICCILFVIFSPISIKLKVALIIVPMQSFIRHINYMVLIEAPKRRNIAYIALQIIDLLVIVLFFFATTAKYEYLILILFIQVVVNLLISFIELKSKIKNLKFTLRLLPKYIKYGIIPMITLFLMTLNYRVDVFMLEHANGVSLSSIGIYSVGVMLAEKVWLFPDAIKDILLSKLCKGEGEKEVAKVIRFSLLLCIFLIIAIVLLGKPFIGFLYGNDFGGAYEITIIMLLGVVGMIFYKMVYSYNIANGRRFISLLFLGISAIINIIGNICFIPIGGIYAAAWSSVISYNICGLCFLIYFCKKGKVALKDCLFIKKEDVLMVKNFFKKKEKKE